MNALTSEQTTALALLISELVEFFDMPTCDNEAVGNLMNWTYEEIHNGIDPRSTDAIRWDMVDALYALMPEMVITEFEASVSEKSEEFYRTIADNTPQFVSLLAVTSLNEYELSWNDRVALWFAKSEFPEWAQEIATQVLAE